MITSTEMSEIIRFRKKPELFSGTICALSDVLCDDMQWSYAPADYLMGIAVRRLVWQMT